MTRKETEKTLNTLKEQIKIYESNPSVDVYLNGNLALFTSRYINSIYLEKLYNVALQYGIDPDSVVFHHDIINGEGMPFRE